MSLETGQDQADSPVLLTRLSLLQLLRARTCSERTYYFDLYGRAHGAFTMLAAKRLGHELVSVWVERVGRWFGLRLLHVPHGDRVPDYHELQLLSEKHTHRLLREYYDAPDYNRGECGFPSGNCAEAADSQLLQDLGSRLLSIVENVRVLEIIDRRPTVVLDRFELPEAFIPVLEKGLGVKVHGTARLDWPIVLLTSLVLGLRVALLAFIGLFRPRLRRGRPDSRAVAVEYVDPSCGRARPTEPNYLVNGGIEADTIVAYVRRSQQKLAPREAFRLEEVAVVFLTDLPLSPADGLRIFRGLGSVVWRSLRGWHSPYTAYQRLDALMQLGWLPVLFAVYDVRVHLYNTIPNGRAATRLDSGLITAVCRVAGVKSISYQSRVMYRQNVYYFFQVFDVFCTWGRAWTREYSRPQFVERFVEIGNVVVPAPPPSPTLGGARTLVLFTGDMDVDHPLHYTYDYNKHFVMACLRALARLSRLKTAPRYRLVLKTKDPEHIELLRADPDIAAAAFEAIISLEHTGRARHDLSESMAMADVALAVGFTTPGLDALSLGIPARYFTPYEDCYIALFGCESGVVLRNVDEVVEFLLDPSLLPDGLMSELDHGCDGRAAQRLGSVVLSELAEQ